MASQAIENGNRDQRTVLAGNQYGRTVLNDGASAILGNYSHNVNISGGLHIHVQPPLTSLTIAAVAVHAVTLSQHFLDIISDILAPHTSFEKLVDFEKLSLSRARLDVSWGPEDELLEDVS